MADDFINFNFSRSATSIIKVIGVGGGGCNAVNHMYEEGIKDVDYIVCNTDGQALENSPVPTKIQLGVTLTEGRGAGNRPEMGEEAALENYDDIRMVLEDNTKMLFITAGMGGGTGTGAAPIIARLARDLDILTIAVVTVPSPAEGHKRHNQAIEGIRRLSEQVDSMLIVSNQRLHSVYGELPARQAFKLADTVVMTAVKGVAEIITLHGNINIDFADVYTVMHDSKVFIMGTGIASGENRAMDAVKIALQSPLLDNQEIKGTKNILLNIISGSEEITIGEIGEIIEYLQKEAGQEADIIWGNGYDESLGNQVSVTILCTGFRNAATYLPQQEKRIEQFTLGKEPIPEVQESLQPQKKEEVPFVLELEIGPVSPLEQEPVVRKFRKPEGVKPSKKKHKPVRDEVGNEPESNIDNWFIRKFSKFFDDDEQNM
jgi:cell division protein FtsZ